MWELLLQRFMGLSGTEEERLVTPPHVFRVLGLKLRHAPMSVGVCLQICMCTMCLQHLRKPEEDAGTIAIGITGSSEGHVGARD